LGEQRALILDDGGWRQQSDTDTLKNAMSPAQYDPTGVAADIYDRANHHGVVPSGSIDGLGGAALLSVGTTAGTVAAGDHKHKRSVSRTRLYFFATS
jgi:hypothetical protein